jgi:tachykinin-like receptor
MYDREVNFCVEEWPKTRMWFASAYSTLWFVFSAIIPVTVMSVLYSRVIYTLWFKRSEHQVQGTQLAMLKSRKRVTKMLVIVCVVYGFCWLPESTIYLLINYGVMQNVADVVYILSFVLVVCNSAINPFIYTLQSGKFRRHLKELVCCRKLRRNLVAVFASNN